MKKEDFIKLFNETNEQNDKAARFATEAFISLKYLQDSGIINEFSKLSTPSQRQNFISTNDAFKKFLKNYEMTNISVAESLETYIDILNGVGGSDITSSDSESKE